MKTTPVRVDENTSEAIKRLSEQTGLSAAKLMTLAVAAFVEKIEREGSIQIRVRADGGKASNSSDGLSKKSRN